MAKHCSGVAPDSFAHLEIPLKKSEEYVAPDLISYAYWLPSTVRNKSTSLPVLSLQNERLGSSPLLYAF